MGKPATRMTVPQLDLKAQYAALKDDILAALARVCESQRFILGPEGDALERELADYCGAHVAVGCASGSDALLLSLVALGVQPGEEVVTVPFTFFSTAGAIARLGARAAFVDIDSKTYTLDPARLEDYLVGLDPERRRRTRAVIPVHLYGQPADMDAINELAKRFELPVIEDAAQALGADYRGRRAGTLGATACFSFYPTKNLGAYGDAGLVTTNDPALADRLRALRQLGCTHEKYSHDVVGWNSRLDEIQAAVLRVKFKRLEEWTRARRRAAEVYDRLFFTAELAAPGGVYPGEEHPVVVPHRAADRRHVFHQYVIRVRERDSLKAFLKEEGVGTEIYYPRPLHLQACFAGWGGRKGDCPESERAAGEVLALPIYPELRGEQQEYVVGKIAEFFQRPA
jgi:dTDP-4-amino-4,6-dideoxygalactose transaminase